MREDFRDVEEIADEFSVDPQVIEDQIHNLAHIEAYGTLRRASRVPAVDEEPLIEAPVDPPGALRTLERLPTRRSIPGVAVLLADRRRR